jgi:hypothetical protein
MISVDDTAVWTLGQSFNGLAVRSPTVITRVDGDAAETKRQAYDQIWLGRADPAHAAWYRQHSAAECNRGSLAGDGRRHRAQDERVTRHSGYAISQVIRKPCSPSRSPPTTSYASPSCWRLRHEPEKRTASRPL